MDSKRQKQGNKKAANGGLEMKKPSSEGQY